MQFHVPQFIDVEDKIFGPLSFKQFIYLVGGAGLCVIVYTLIPYRFISYLLIPAIAAFSLALAFYEVNNKPFIHIVQAAFNYITNSRLYLWQRVEHEEKSGEQIEKEAAQIQKVVADMAEAGSERDRLKSKSFAIDVGDGSPQTPEQEPTHTSPNRSPS